MPAKKPRKSAFVPRMLMRTALVSVIPACALGCGSSDTGGPTTTSDTGTKDTGPFGVAAVAYPAYETGTDSTADSPTDGPADSNKADSGKEVFGVAAVAYPAYESGTPG
jgi:hypothetical protein